MNTRTLISTAAFLAIVAASILAAVASSVVPTEGADRAPYGFQSASVEPRHA
ncbi:hypothetical protein ACFPOE_19200 [Caenimonas terrae]|uniref:Uncharacterized protein n=1 Tax=Caenimonas terrae TaxID=696074 RepID=A0ABW0NJD2_9BURK